MKRMRRNVHPTLSSVHPVQNAAHGGKRFSEFKSELRHVAIYLNSITQLMTNFTVDQAVDYFPDQSTSCLV